MAGNKNKVSASMRVKGVDDSPVVPASRPLNDPNPKNQKDPLDGLRGLHVNGEPIEEWAAHMPDEVVQRMSYPLTDEGQEEQHRLERRRDMRLPVTGQIASDEADKRVIRYRDGLATNHLVLGQDPLQQLMDEHLPKGHSGLWIGAKKEGESGLVRGVLKYEPVLVPDGKGGHRRVEQNGMYLASVPIEAKEQADAYYAEIAQSRAVSVVEKVQEKTEQVFGEAGMKSLARRKHTLDHLEGLRTDDAEAADAELLHEEA